jgi:hypothetical protein
MALTVVEPETGEALEVEIALALLKVATEVEVLVIRRVVVGAEEVVEDPEVDEEASVVEVGVEDEAASTRQKDHQHQLRQRPLRAIPELAILESLSAVSHQSLPS